jgi:hypothetical protein
MEGKKIMTQPEDRGSEATRLAMELTRIWVEHHSECVKVKARDATALNLDAVLTAFNTARNWALSYILK